MLREEERFVTCHRGRSAAQPPSQQAALIDNYNFVRASRDEASSLNASWFVVEAAKWEPGTAAI